MALVVLVLCFCASTLQASDGERGGDSEDVDHLAIAARLLRDGHRDRAEVVLRQVDPSQPGLDVAKYHTLFGLTQLEQGRHEAAQEHLEKSISKGQTELVVFSYLAQAQFGLKQWQGVVDSLEKAGPSGRVAPGLFLMRARAWWELGKHSKAFDALGEGRLVFPEADELERARLTYLIDLGLFQEVARVGSSYLSRNDATADDYAVVAEGLRRSKQIEEAKNVLETARLRFPENSKLAVLLAHTYLDAGQPLAGAMLFEEASRSEPERALEAAELYLKAGRVQRALSLNARVFDQKAKMKQRLSILIELERYEEVAAMESRLERLGLFEEESVRYALAYACFKTGQFDRAEAQLKHLTQTRLFEQGIELRRAMQACLEASWECR